MNQNHFGELLAALRKEQYDPRAGKVWSQARLAQETGLSEKIIGDIERGSRSTLESDIIVRFADAFSFNTMERKAFFSLFRSVEQAMVPATDDSNVYHDCLDLLQNLQLPAALQDSYYNLIAVNQSWCRLYDVPSDFWHKENDSARYNFIRLLLDPASNMRRVLGRSYRKIVEEAVGIFRWMSLPYRHTEYYSDIFSCLMMFNEFGRAWMTTQFATADLRSSIKTVSYNHHPFGKLSYHIAKSRIETCYGPIYYSTLLPCSAATANVFTDFMANGGDHVLPLSPFPAANPPLTSATDEMSQLFTRSYKPAIR